MTDFHKPGLSLIDIREMEGEDSPREAEDNQVIPQLITGGVILWVMIDGDEEGIRLSYPAARTLAIQLTELTTKGETK